MELKELDNILKELTHLIRTQEKRVNYHKTKAEHLTIAFLLLTSIFFFSISHHSSSLQCKHWWMPFTFFLLSSLSYFMAFVDAVIMYYRIQYHADMTHIEQQLVYSKILQIKSHSIQIGEFRSAAAAPLDEVEIIEPDAVHLFKRKVFIFLTISVLAGFTLLMLYACRVLLCDGNSEAAAAP